jgi:hypothetical protein
MIVRFVVFWIVKSYPLSRLHGFLAQRNIIWFDLMFVIVLGSATSVAMTITRLKPVGEPGYFVASWWRTPLRHPPKVTIDQ